MSIKANTHKALTAAHDYAAAIEGLRKDCRGKTREEARAIMLPAVASFPKYNVPLVDGDKSAQGRKVMDSTHPKFETARKALNRLLNDIGFGEQPTEAHKAHYTRAQRKAAKDFLAMFDSVAQAKACLAAL